MTSAVVFTKISRGLNTIFIIGAVLLACSCEIFFPGSKRCGRDPDTGEEKCTFIPPFVAAASNRFTNAINAKNNTENLADLAEASCGGARAAQAAETARNARTAATNVQIAMDMFNDTPEAYARVDAAVKAAAQASRLAYYMVISCGGVPPEVPRIPVYYETFWDVASP